ncbi:unnamed protein product, partial [marine sediment metagenome]
SCCHMVLVESKTRACEKFGERIDFFNFNLSIVERMPLEIFAIITPLGIALIVLIVRYSGLSKNSRLNDSQNAIDILLKDFAGEKVSGKAIVMKDHRAAFIEMDKTGHLGLVEAVGDKFITRLLNPGEISSFVKQNENTLLVRFRDFTHPTGNYEFDMQRDLSTVSGWLSKLEKKG